MARRRAKPGFQTVQLPIGGGLNSEWEPHLIPDGYATVADNVFVRSNGSYQKVVGGAQIGSSSATQNRLLSYEGQQLVSVGPSSSFRLTQAGSMEEHEGLDRAFHTKSEWRGLLPFPGEVRSINIAHKDGYTAIVAAVVHDTQNTTAVSAAGSGGSTAVPTNVIADRTAVCFIADENDTIIWGPVEVDDIRFHPRVEAIEVSSSARFVFFGCDADHPTTGTVPTMALKAFQANPISYSAPSTITVETILAVGNSYKTLYDSHSSGSDAVAYVSYYSNTDGEIVVNRIDGSSSYTADLLVATTADAMAVYRDTVADGVYVSVGTNIYSLSADLASKATYAGAVDADRPVFYLDGNSTLYCNGMTVGRISGTPPTLSFTGSVDHTTPHVARRPAKLTSASKSLFFSQHSTDQGTAGWAVSALQEDPSSVDRAVVVTCPLQNYEPFGGLRFTSLIGTSNFIGAIGQSAVHDDGAVLAPFALKIKAYKTYPPTGGVLYDPGFREGGPYNFDSVLGYWKLTLADDATAGVLVNATGSSLGSLGHPLVYDGQKFFNYLPKCPTPSTDFTASATSYGYREETSDIYNSGSTPDDYNNIQWWAAKWVTVVVDADGNEIRSEPSDALTFNGIAGDTGDTWPRYSFDDFEADPRLARYLHGNFNIEIEMYVTERDDGTTAGNSVGASNEVDIVHSYYRCQRVPLQEDGSGFFIPDFLTMAAQGLDGGASVPLYTDLDELAPRIPPAANSACVVGGYAWLCPSEVPSELWHSKPLEFGRVPEFNPLLTILAPNGLGDAIAVSGLGDRLVIFSERGISEIFVGAGGPSATGVGAFSAPRKIHEGDGIIGAQALVETAAGIFYVAQSGPKMLGPGGQVQDIGRLVKDDFDVTLVNGVTVFPKEYEVWVFMSDGQHFIFNYRSGVWTTASDLAGVNGVVVGSTPYRITNLGVVIQESDTSTDNSESILATITTGWIDLAQNQSYKRIRKVHALIRHIQGSLGTLSFKIAYDYDDTVVDTRTWNASDYTTLNEVGHFDIRLSRQKCSAIKISIVEGTETQGQSQVNDIRWALTNLSLEVMGKRGNFKLEQGAKK